MVGLVVICREGGGVVSVGLEDPWDSVEVAVGISLNLNTKLFSSTNNAISWDLEHALPWV